MEYAKPATTDDLLNSLEIIIQYFQPVALFQNIQIVNTLTDQSTLNSNYLGKAFVSFLEFCRIRSLTLFAKSGTSLSLPYR